MIDASHEPFDKNIEITKRVVERAHAKGIVRRGRTGHARRRRGGHQVEEGNACLTDPAEAERVRQAERLRLAGLRHRHQPRRLQVQGQAGPALRRAREDPEARCPGFPLVMHGSLQRAARRRSTASTPPAARSKGASGVDPNAVSARPPSSASARSTSTPTAAWSGRRVHREFFRDKPAEFDLRPPGKIFMDEYAKFIASRNELLGSAGTLAAVRDALAKK